MPWLLGGVSHAKRATSLRKSNAVRKAEFLDDFFVCGLGIGESGVV